MPTIKRYFPGFVDVDDEDRVTVPFSTTEDLLTIPWVKKWTTDGDFSHFAQSGRHLMAVLKDGFEWWVVGILADETPLLPKLETKYLLVLPNGRPCVARDSEVAVSSGDWATLRDGRVCNLIRV